MAKLELQTGENNEVLRAVAKEVTEFDSKLKKLVKNMKDTMVAADGLGIAAPQVGLSTRVFIATLGYRKDSSGTVVAMVNPELRVLGDVKEVAEEGCLSLPKVYGKVERPRDVEIEYSDVDGERLVLRLSGLDARVVQHELDHLNGVLFIDKLYGGGESGTVGVM